MKKVSAITFALLLGFSLFSSANQPDNRPLTSKEVAKMDFSGKWSGKRFQYTADHQAFQQTFEYDFDLKQEGQVVTGTSTIINPNGDYADMKLKGVVVGNKLHFEEYEIKGQSKQVDRVWCYKSGELEVQKEGNNIRLIGETPSFMADYNMPCTGGVTNLVKADNSTIQNIFINEPNIAVKLDNSIVINAFPNPYVQKATITYSIPTDAQVKMDVIDIQGKQIASLENSSKKAGNYTLDFNSGNKGFLTGVFIVRFDINGEIYSRQIVQIQ